mgnify:FL=1
MTSEELEILGRARRENPAANIANESFVCGTVAMLAITALDDEQVLERMTSDEARAQAAIYRTIVAFALRGAVLCERRAAQMQSVAA